MAVARESGGGTKKRKYQPAVSKAKAMPMTMASEAKMLKMMKSRQKKMGM